MPIYRPNELFAFLNDENLAPKKSLSQNFLIDGNIVRKIADLAVIQPGDVVLEIGPGPGVLTEELLRRGAEVIAIEMDRGFADKLKRFEGPLTILQEDVLETDLENILMKVRKPVKVISNLPYHITTPIIVKLLSYRSMFSKIVVMVQEEVARRFTGKPKTKDYSSITVFISFFSHCTYGFKVKKSCFMPMPKVDSAVVVIEPSIPPLQEEKQRLFINLVRTAFNQRRKTLRSALNKLYPKERIQMALENICLNINARAEELTLEEFLRLFHALLSIEEK